MLASSAMINTVEIRKLIFPFVAFLALQGISAAEMPYLYHRGSAVMERSLSVEMESAYGTREAGSLGEKGVEEGLRLRYGILDGFWLEAWGGTLFDRGIYLGEAGSAEADVRLLNQYDQQVNLVLGAGAMRDFTGVLVPMARLTLNRRLGKLDLLMTGMAQKPMSVGRDSVDIIAGTAASFETTINTRVGAEFMAEDLEGFWEEEEAEGGARLIAGPTFFAALEKGLELKLNAGWVYAATKSVLPDMTTAPKNESGFLGRVSFGYIF